MSKTETKMEQVFIGQKELPKYLTAAFYALGKQEKVLLTARGNNIITAINVAAILIRQYLDNPTYEITIGSEKFNERYVSTIDIIVKGKQKNVDTK